MRSQKVIITILLVVSGSVFSVFVLVNTAVNSRRGPEHIFTVSDSAQFLTEERALSKARDTLAEEKLDPAVWQPVPDGRTKDPNGRADVFMARNAINPNRGTFLFTNKPGS